ncbi:putative sulfate transporter 4.2 [Raphanus sativus]|nr:putative sulfate transporter 4.2 [Raphanus sativus]
MAKIKRMTFFDWLDTLFPCFIWIRSYRGHQYFKLDLMAGITVGIMLVPQSMSYAKLAGLQPIYDSSLVPVFVYAVFGSSRQLAIGPVALFKWPPFLLGSTILVVLLVMKQCGKSKQGTSVQRAAGPLTGLALGTTIAKVFHSPTISLVGDIPLRPSEFSLPKSFDHAKIIAFQQRLSSLVVAILESVGIAKALGAKNRYELDSIQRSAVNSESEAKTGLSGLVTGIIIGCSLLFLTPVFKYIPQCALAAIVISAVSGLVDYEGAIFLWRVDKRDFTLWTITSTTTLFFGIEIGVLVGVTVLGRLPGTTVYRNMKQYPEAYTYNGIVIVRIDAPIYFANISYIKDRLREYEVAFDKHTNKGPEGRGSTFLSLKCLYNGSIEYFVYNAAVTYIDSSAVEALKDLYEEYKTRDIQQLAVSNPNKEVLLTLARSGIVELIGKEWYFVRVHDAVQVCLHYVESKNQTPTNVDERSSSSLWRRCSSAKNSSHTEVEADSKLALKEPLLSNEK